MKRERTTDFYLSRALCSLLIIRLYVRTWLWQLQPSHLLKWQNIEEVPQMWDFQFSSQETPRQTVKWVPSIGSASSSAGSRMLPWIALAKCSGSLRTGCLRAGPDLRPVSMVKGRQVWRLTRLRGSFARTTCMGRRGKGQTQQKQNKHWLPTPHKILNKQIVVCDQEREGAILCDWIGKPPSAGKR